MNIFKTILRKFKQWQLLRLYRRLDKIQHWIYIKEMKEQEELEKKEIE